MLALAAVVFSGCFGASDGDRSTDSGSIALSRDSQMQSIDIPAGTLIDARLEQELSPVGNRSGDHVSAIVTAPIVVDGKTAIPSGARIHGHVTSIEESRASDGARIVNLDFTEVEFANESYPMEVSLVSAHPRMRSNTTKRGTAAKIGATTIGGAILGRILGGDAKSTAMGAIAGAATGTAIVLGTRDSYAVLPAGSMILLRTREPLYVLVER